MAELLWRSRSSQPRIVRPRTMERPHRNRNSLFNGQTLVKRQVCTMNTNTGTIQAWDDSSARTRWSVERAAFSLIGRKRTIFLGRSVGSPKELAEYHPARHFPLSRKEPRFDSIEVILGVIESADVLITTTHDTLSTALEAANGLRSRDSDKRPNHAPVLYDKGRNCLQLSEGRLLL